MWPLGMYLSFPLCVNISLHLILSPNRNKIFQIFQDDVPQGILPQIQPSQSLLSRIFSPRRQDRYTQKAENRSLKPIWWPRGQGSYGHIALTFIFSDLVPREQVE